MNEDVDETYRRASALDPSRPSDASRRRVLEHAAALAAERSAVPRPAETTRPRARAGSARWRPALFGTLAAAALAGLMIVPRFFNPHPPTSVSADTAALTTPPGAAAPAPLSPAPAATAPPAPVSTAPAARPPEALSRQKTDQPRIENYALQAQNAAKAPPRSADVSRLAAPRLEEFAAQPDAGAAAAPAAPQQAAAPAEAGGALRRAAELGDIPGLERLLTNQFDLEARDSGGRTALMLAALHGQAKSVDVLLAHGADPNAVDVNGTTPLEAARAADHPAIVAALRRAGAR